MFLILQTIVYKLYSIPGNYSVIPIDFTQENYVFLYTGGRIALPVLYRKNKIK